MKLLLHADIPKLGYFGDVVEVTKGYARNYLLPQGLAVEPTETNVKAIEEERAQKAEERRLAREQMVKAVDKVEGAEITIRALANEMGHLFGSVSEADVAAALRDARYEVQAKHVRLATHLRTIGTHEVKLRFAEDLSAMVTVHIIRPEDEADESEPEQDSDETES
jgi:large subunit ribosomal protein L9